ncbi:MAG: calcium-binding protein [Hyphomonadaceae bacterium]
MKFGLFAAATLALVAGVASAQPPDGPRGGDRGPKGGFGLLQFDANADGRLTKAEFDSAQKTRFDKIDANKDGSATPEEFQAAWKAEADARRVDISKERFTTLDADKNGQISQSEFAATKPMRDGRGGPNMRGGRGPHPAKMDGAKGPQRAGPRDADSNGNLTFAEFSARGAAAFVNADTNKDGTVTIAELQASRPGRN